MNYKDIKIEISDPALESLDLFPTYSTDGSSGFDLKANISSPVVLKPMERRLISTGLRIELEEGYELQVRPRSGLALKEGITVLNTPGTVDSDYRGIVGVILINLSMEDVTINPGQRIAQGVILNYTKADFIRVKEVNRNTNRKDNGFGSSGKF